MNQQYTYKKSVTLSVLDIYGQRDFYEPPGFKLTGEFRPPKAGEHYLSTVASYATDTPVDFSINKPRLILTPAPVRKQYIFTETGEDRHVKEGEWYLGVTFEIPFQADYDDQPCGPRKILTLEVREIQEP